MVEVDEGRRVVSVSGDRDDPLFGGYTCIKGRQIPDQMADPKRIRQPLRRRPDGTFEETTSGEALDGIADTHGELGEHRRDAIVEGAPLVVGTVRAEPHATVRNVEVETDKAVVELPSPRAGTVTPDVAKVVQEYKAGKGEFRNDSGGNVHAVVGKLSFDNEKLIENIEAFLDEDEAKRRAEEEVDRFQGALETTKEQIITLKNGRITESGNHDELMAAGGYYARMVRIQEIEEGDTHVR